MRIPRKNDIIEFKKDLDKQDLIILKKRYPLNDRFRVLCASERYVQCTSLITFYIHSIPTYFIEIIDRGFRNL